jgi:hypothetical protein
MSLFNANQGGEDLMIGCIYRREYGERIKRL